MIARTVFGLYAWSVGVLVAVPVAIVALLLCRTRRSAWRLLRHGLRLSATLTGLRVELSVAPGARLPAGAFVGVSNHTSFLDVLALIAALGEPVAFTSKREVFDLPLIGPFARRIGAIPVERSSLRRRAEARRAAAETLRAGTPVHVFPEATFSQRPGLLPFRLGAFRLAAETGMPVVPIAVAGTRRCLPAGAALPRPGRIEVRVLPAVLPPPEPDARAMAAFRDGVRRTLADELGEPLL